MNNEEKQFERRKIVDFCKNLAIDFLKMDCYVIANEMVELTEALYFDEISKIANNRFIIDKDGWREKERNQIKEYCKKYLGMSFE